MFLNKFQVKEENQEEIKAFLGKIKEIQAN